MTGLVSDAQRRSLEQRGVPLSIVYYTHLLLPSNNLSYTLNFHFVITPSYHTLPKIQSQILCIVRTHKQSRQSTHQRKVGESPPVAQLNSPTLGDPVVITGPRIAAACARALPARTAHLSGWTHRLRPSALHACPCTQHNSQHTSAQAAR